MPILWRILIAQAHIYKAIKNTREMKDSKAAAVFKTLTMIPEHDRQQFDWRQSNEEASDNEVYVDPFNAVGHYLHDKLSDFM